MQKIESRDLRESCLKGLLMGSPMPKTANDYVYQLDEEGNDAFAIQSVTTVPLLHNCIKEVFDNAKDHAASYIEITVDRQTNVVRVKNDVEKPIAMEDAQRAFCDFLSSSNYDESKPRTTTIGKNGVGIKGTNCWSTEFKFVVANALSHRKREQTCRSNLTIVGSPKVTRYTKKTSFVEVAFVLDFDRMKAFAPSSWPAVQRGFFAMVTRQVYDLAACCTNVKVKYNDGRHVRGMGIGFDNIQRGLLPYLQKFQKPVYACANKSNATVCVMEAIEGIVSPNFVNKALMRAGGTHVNEVRKHFFASLSIPKEFKDVKNLKQKLKRLLWFVVSCEVESPMFDAQSKNELTTPLSWPSMWTAGSVKTCMDTLGIWDLLRDSHFPKKKVATRTSASVDVPKLQDAKKVNKEECTIILTEGDSAKNLAVAGLSTVGRNRYGVYPLKGKPKNEKRGAGKKKVKKGEDILDNLCKIIGLKKDRSYPGGKNLRYQHVLIMCDADASGYHIAALLINFIHGNWPELLQVKGFLKLMQTPLIRVTMGSQMKEFLTTEEFEAWKVANPSTSYRCKYLKGLGSSKTSDAKRWFRDLDRYVKVFRFDEHAMTNIERAFGKDTAVRKDILLGNPVKDWGHADPFSLSGFMEHYLANIYWKDELRTKIPHVMDFLVESQRKAFCYMPTTSKRVAQQAAKVSERGGYHHGEASMINTINNGAQVFKKNIHPFYPDGQFGSMDTYGGAAQPRYTATRRDEGIEKWFVEFTKFPENLPHTEVEGETHEPDYLAPILPALVNGYVGAIGVGFSSSIPRYNPKDIYELLHGYLSSNKPFEDLANEPELTPWYRGWLGPIKKEDGKWMSYGVVSKRTSHTVVVTAIPVETAIQSWMDAWRNDPSIKKVSNESKFVTYDQFGPSIDMMAPKIRVEFREPVEEEGLLNRLKLHKQLKTSNMHLWTVNNTFKKYGSVQEILYDYCVHRAALYESRRQLLMNRVEKERQATLRKQQWIQKVVDGVVPLPFPDTLVVEGLDPPYDDLLNIPLGQCQVSAIRKMEDILTDLANQLLSLQATTPRAMWKQELEAWHASFYGSGKRKRALSSSKSHSKKHKNN